MFRFPFLSTALVAAALAVPVSAQLQVFGGDSPRMSSMRIFWDDGPVGMVCIQYGQPDWKQEYDGLIKQLEGKQLRLGKDFWTTLNTSNALTIGGTMVPAGSYYLGLKCDEKQGFHLLVMRAEAADKKGWTPFVADVWKADHTCAMKKGNVDDTAGKMTIALADAGDDKTQLTLSITWGTHQLTAPVKVHLGGGEEEVVEVVEEAVEAAVEKKKK